MSSYFMNECKERKQYFQIHRSISRGVSAQYIILIFEPNLFLPACVPTRNFNLEIPLFSSAKDGLYGESIVHIMLLMMTSVARKVEVSSREYKFFIDF